MGIAAVGIYVAITVSQNTKNNDIITPQTKISKTVPFVLDIAPSESLRGIITSLSGHVGWQSRIATMPASLISPRFLQQGEGLQTEDDGKITFEIAKDCTVTLFPNSELDIIQTLPVNLVFAQNKGIVEYKKTGDDPLSVRTFGMLIKQESGDITISIDTDNNIVSVAVNSGSITAAFNDSQNVTTKVSVSQGKTLEYFDDTRRTRILNSR